MPKMKLPDGLSIIEVNEENFLTEGIGCISNKKHPGYKQKNEWLDKRFSEGLRMALLKRESKVLGMIEYVPAEYSWRPISAKDFMFIQCLWVYKHDEFGRGFGSFLVQHVIEVAQKKKLKGCVVVTSDGSWLADMRVFLKNGFEFVEKKERYDLLTIKFKKTQNPGYIDWEKNRSQFQGLHLIYANQCPMFGKCVPEIIQFAEENGVDINLHLISTAKEAQHAPTGYGVFSIIYNGELVSDHYISKARFRNILQRELKLI